MKKNMLIIVIAFAIMIQSVILPVQAKGLDPYEGFSTGLADSASGAIDTPYNEKGAKGVRAGGVLCYKDIDFGEKGPIAVEIQTASPEAFAGSLEIRVDSSNGKLLCEIERIPSDWGNYIPQQAQISVKVTGVHDLYIIARSGVCDMESIVFTAAASAEFGYEIYKKGSTFSDVEDERLAVALDKLTQLGIIKASDDGIYIPELPVSRQEFAYSVYRLFVEPEEVDPYFTSDSEIKESVKLDFEDVDRNGEYAKAISYVSSMGFMNGVGENKFAPAEYITYIDALTVIVRALGFKEMAEVRGGYPTGYLEIANTEGLIDRKIEINDVLYRDDKAFLFEKVIEADYLDAGALDSNGGVYLNRKEGILSRNRGIYEGSGKIMAVPVTRLEMPGSDLDFNEIAIGNEIYNIGETNATSMLGFQVDFWYDTDGDTKTIRAIVPKNKTEVISLSSATDSIIDITENSLTYIKAGENDEEEVIFDDETSLVYNGLAADAKITDLIDYENNFNGFITIVENGDGSKVVMFEEYVDVVLESVDTVNQTIKGSNYSNLIYTNATKNYVLMKNQAGGKVKAEDLAAGTILTVFQSKNKTGKKLVRVFTSGDTLTGKITKWDGKTYYVNDEKAVFSNYYTGSKDIGVERTFGLNIYGDIVTESSVKNVPKVGLFFGSSGIGEGIDGELSIKIMDTTAKTSIYPLAKKVKIDGVTYSKVTAIEEGEDTWAGLENLAKETPVLYRVNASGLITMIDTPGVATDDPDNVLEVLPGSTTTMNRSGSIMINASTGAGMFYCSPTAVGFSFHGTEDRENHGVAGSVSTIASTSSINITGKAYTTSRNNYTLDILVHNSVWVEDEYPFIFKSVETKVDANGELINVLKGVRGETALEFTIGDTFMSANENTLTNLKTGDIITILNTPGVGVSNLSVILLCDGMPSRTGMDKTPSYSKDNPIYTAATGKRQNYYLFGTVKERNDKYMILDHGAADENSADDELVDISGKKLNQVLTRTDGTTIIKGGQKDTIIQDGDVVFLYYSYGTLTTFALFDGLQL